MQEERIHICGVFFSPALFWSWGLNTHRQQEHTLPVRSMWKDYSLYDPTWSLDGNQAPGGGEEQEIHSEVYFWAELTC